MTSRPLLFLGTALSLFPLPLLAREFSPEITAPELRERVEWLASPEREGRATGSPGAKASADWIAAAFAKAGLQKFGDSYLQPFEFQAGVQAPPTGNKLAVTAKAGEQTFAFDQDFRPLPFSASGPAEGEVVFAGYALSVPEGQGVRRYNSYDGLDVSGKIVLAFRYVPEGVDATRRAQLNRYAGLRYKAMMARERGAKAILFISGPNSPQAGELIPLTSDAAFGDSGIITHSISTKAAEALIAASGKSLKSLQTALDDENPHAEGGFLIPETKVSLAAGIERVRKQDFNVVGYLPPADEAQKPADTEWIIAGAHYDHLGLGGESSSLARSGEEKRIHAGADDNASGVALIMELADSLAAERKAHPEKFRRGMIFALWSGEEMGILGSASFCEKPPVNLEKVAAYVNFDMVGRLRDNKLSLQAAGSSKAWRRMIEKRNVAAGFDISVQEDPYLPTDVTSFYPKRIPVLNFFTGSHDDYHRPTDTAEKLEYDGLQRIALFSQGIFLDLLHAAERPEYTRVEKSDSGGGSRETLRAYLGTIPDYATDVKGVKLSGVRGGSPGEKAGIQGGDILIEFAGQKIANIYDYTYALDAVKIGQPVKVKVLRHGDPLELTVIPEARK